jgi:hypothetical protein
MQLLSGIAVIYDIYMPLTQGVRQSVWLSVCLSTSFVLSLTQYVHLSVSLTDLFVCSAQTKKGCYDFVCLSVCRDRYRCSVIIVVIIVVLDVFVVRVILV